MDRGPNPIEAIPEVCGVQINDLEARTIKMKGGIPMWQELTNKNGSKDGYKYHIKYTARE